MIEKLDYDEIAPVYDRRYVDGEYPGISAALQNFVGDAGRVLEVGCGTGHWLEQMRSWGCRVSGLDPSAQMLERAAARKLDVDLVRGRAESLPFSNASFERVVCINALHHVAGKQRFIAEARRVLAAGGRFLSIGLDPSAGLDSWFIYDYFETTLELDRQRYPAAAQVRGWLSAAGFVAGTTVVAEHIVLDRAARDCLDRGLITKRSTSQLALLSDAHYQRGMDRIRSALTAAEAAGRSLRLTGDLRLYGTLASVPESVG
jgi:ubiquinone/menaquinone biosynthesis C-methylase UbiE